MHRRCKPAASVDLQWCASGSPIRSKPSVARSPTSGRRSPICSISSPTRVAAVQARESELREAIGRASNGAASTPIPGARLAAPAALPPSHRREATSTHAQLRALADRERAVAAREAELGPRGRTARRQAQRPGRRDRRERGQLRINGSPSSSSASRTSSARRPSCPTGRSSCSPSSRPRAKRPQPWRSRRPPSRATRSGLAKIEARLAELRIAEEAFDRTREELAARSEAVAARERLVGERERELAEREDGWGSVELHELESRLRRLEQQKTAPAPSGFASGMRKLEQQGKRSAPVATPSVG